MEKVDLDFIGRFETIGEDSDRVFRTLGLKDVHLPMINKTDHASYKECYCKESKEIVEKFYEEDFRILGYEYDDSF